MPERKYLFSVSDREKIDNCLCMKCEHPICLMLDGKSCKLLISILKNTTESGITVTPSVTKRKD